MGMIGKPITEYEIPDPVDVPDFVPDFVPETVPAEWEPDKIPS